MADRFGNSNDVIGRGKSECYVTARRKPGTHISIFYCLSQGLYTLGTVVVDYRGYRVIAQSIIPGMVVCLLFVVKKLSNIPRVKIKEVNP